MVCSWQASSDEEELQQLEADISLNDVLLFRTLAERAMASVSEHHTPRTSTDSAEAPQDSRRDSCHDAAGVYLPVRFPGTACCHPAKPASRMGTGQSLIHCGSFLAEAHWMVFTCQAPFPRYDTQKLSSSASD